MRIKPLLPSATAGVVLALCHVSAGVPWLLWAAWAVLTVLAVRQAVRATP